MESSDLTGAASSPGTLRRDLGVDPHEYNSSRLTLPTISRPCSVCHNIKICRISENSIFLYCDIQVRAQINQITTRDLLGRSIALKMNMVSFASWWIVPVEIYWCDIACLIPSAS